MKKSHLTSFGTLKPYFTSNLQSLKGKLFLLVLPYGILPVFGAFIAFPATQDFTLQILKENNIVEMLTFIILFISCIIGLRLCLKLKGSINPYTNICILLISLGFFMVAMEEIAWGQQILKFNTPALFEEINAQNELTLHNIGQLQGKSEYFRLFFGLTGLVGIAFSKVPILKDISPPKYLIHFFVVITSFTLLDLFLDYYPINANLDKGIQRLSEVVELLIAIASYFYIIHISNQLYFEIKNQTKTSF